MSSTRRSLLQAGLLGGVGSLLPPAHARSASAGATPPATDTRARGIVFMVSDGMSHGVLPLAEALSRQVRNRSTRWWELLASPGCVQGSVDTAAANSLVTDSAAASSAWGSGRRVPNGHINVTAEGRRLESLGEKLKAQGCRLGLVTTATVTHATPAGFAASVPSRGDEDGIALQYLDRADIILGGGSRFFDRDHRRDKADLFADFATAGYQVARTRDEMLASRSPRLLGTFADGYLPYSIDHARDEELAKKVPTLAEMSEAALQRLLADDAPFLLQIEGARIDHAAHANDVAALLRDQLAFDDALAAVLTAAADRDDILVIVTSDHGNANPGLNGMGAGYGRTNDHFARIAAIRSSHEHLFAQWRSRKPRSGGDDLAVFIERHLGFRPTTDEAEALRDTLDGGEVTEWNHLLANPNGVLGQIAGNHTGIGWTGTVHTADLAPITAVGAQAPRFHGLIPNHAIHEKLLASLLG